MTPNQFGIDGCKAGWLAIWLNGNNYHFGVFKTLQQISECYPKASRYLIDIPVGLGSKSHPRTIDCAMRQQLPKRQSTVFNTPCREAVYASDYQSAKKVNLAIEGKSLSQQSFHISAKIREADKFHSQRPNIELIESHPEIAFKYLNGRNVILTKKSKAEGIAERLSVLENYNRKVIPVYEKILSKTLRKDVARDDIVDALCLSVTLEWAGQNLSFIQDRNTFDQNRIPIRIGVYDKTR